MWVAIFFGDFASHVAMAAMDVADGVDQLCRGRSKSLRGTEQSKINLHFRPEAVI